MKGPESVAALAAGTALGAVVEGGYVMLSVAVAAAGAAALLVMLLRPRPWMYMIPLFAAGFCRGLAWQVGGGTDGIQELPMIRSAYSALGSAIGRAGFSEEAVPLLKALVAGDRSGIPADIRDAFRISGASHILALSGMHLGIIYAIVTRILGLGGGHPVVKTAGSVLTVAVCGFYAVMTGASPSIMRAFLFILLRETALATGRSAAPLTVFSTALMLHLLFSPGNILMPGFQLSYLAMCGIYLVFPHLAAIYPKAKYDPLKKIWDVACLSISCQLFTAPAAWFHFHSFPKWFLLTNMIAMPLSTMLMVTAITATALSSLGICPVFVVRLADVLASALTSALSVISTL